MVSQCQSSPQVGVRQQVGKSSSVPGSSNPSKPYLLGPSLVKWHNRWMDYEKNTIEPFKKRVEEHKQKQRRLEEKQQQQQSQ
jgi:hypothetical protein